MKWKNYQNSPVRYVRWKNYIVFPRCVILVLWGIPHMLIVEFLYPSQCTLHNDVGHVRGRMLLWSRVLVLVLVLTSPLQPLG